MKNCCLRNVDAEETRKKEKSISIIKYFKCKKNNTFWTMLWAWECSFSLNESILFLFPNGFNGDVHTWKQDIELKSMFAYCGKRIFTTSAILTFILSELFKFTNPKKRFKYIRQGKYLFCFLKSFLLDILKGGSLLYWGDLKRIKQQRWKSSSGPRYLFSTFTYRIIDRRIRRTQASSNQMILATTKIDHKQKKVKHPLFSVCQSIIV